MARAVETAKAEFQEEQFRKQVELVKKELRAKQRGTGFWQRLLNRLPIIVIIWR